MVIDANVEYHNFHQHTVKYLDFAINFLVATVANFIGTNNIVAAFNLQN